MGNRKTNTFKELKEVISKELKQSIGIMQGISIKDKKTNANSRGKNKVMEMKNSLEWQKLISAG